MITYHNAITPLSFLRTLASILLPNPHCFQQLLDLCFAIKEVQLGNQIFQTFHSSWRTNQTFATVNSFSVSSGSISLLHVEMRVGSKPGTFGLGTRGI